MGFLRACVCTMRGTPWIARGSFIKEGSSLAGTVAEGTTNSRYESAVSVNGVAVNGGGLRPGSRHVQGSEHIF